MGGALVLGPVVFQGFEIPARLQFGGRQRLAVHELAGGGRVVDAMGAQEEPVSWAGVVSGPDAAERVRLLERLRRSGTVLPLSWEGWLYTVVIESFDATAMNPAWIPYKLQACVVTAGDAVTAAAEAAGAVVASFGGVTGTDAQIAAASGLLMSADPVVAMAAAGSLARMVAGNALAAGGGL